MKRLNFLLFGLLTVSLSLTLSVSAQQSQQSYRSDSSSKKYKNIIRYNLSGALLFGMDKYLVFGYERVVNKRQSFSINIGRAALPKLISFSTDSVTLTKDLKNSGFQVSADYRFYLSKENRYDVPHGVYIGPFYSYNGYKRDNSWNYKTSTGTTSVASSQSDISIHVIGAEMGYQFILWKRLALDMLLIGPGFGRYKIDATIQENLPPAQKEKFYEALKQLLEQKVPGMNYVLSDHEFDANGKLRTWNIGFRYIIHVGFLF
jgi:hypothetical protein